MDVAKAALLLAWLLCGAGFVIAPDSTLALWARYAFWLMLGAHAIECALFFPRIRRAGGSFLAHLGNTIVFGVLHIRELPPESDTGHA